MTKSVFAMKCFPICPKKALLRFFGGIAIIKKTRLNKMKINCSLK